MNTFCPNMLTMMNTLLSIFETNKRKYLYTIWNCIGVLSTSRFGFLWCFVLVFCGVLFLLFVVKITFSDSFIGEKSHFLLN